MLLVVSTGSDQWDLVLVKICARFDMAIRKRARAFTMDGP
jgi:hypothetical protein